MGSRRARPPTTRRPRRRPPGPHRRWRSPVLRVLCRWTPTGTPSLFPAPPARAPAGARRPRSCRRRRSPPRPPRRSARRVRSPCPRSTFPSKGQPNETLIETLTGRSVSIRSSSATDSSTVRFALRRLNSSVAPSVKCTASRPHGREPLVALLVEDEPGVGDAVAALDPRDDLLGAGHLRHALGARTKLTASMLPEPRSREAVDELRAHLRRERLRLVLEAVARADVADRDGGCHSLAP